MAGFLYFIPKVSSISEQRLKELGLGYAFSNGSVAATPCATGPLEPCGGCLVADNKNVPIELHKKDPDNQSWRKIPGALSNGENICIGFNTTHRPQPKDLLRNTALPGHGIELEDGNLWTIPAAISWQNNEAPFCMRALPEVLGVDEEGAWQRGVVVAKYAKLWEVCQYWWDVRMKVEAEDGEEVVLEEDSVFDNAVLALATNYRMSKIEVATLQLLSDKATGQILDAVIDLPTLNEFTKETQKKIAAPDGSSF